MSWLRRMMGCPAPDEKVSIVSFQKERPLSTIDPSRMKHDPSNPDLAPDGSRSLSDDGQRIVPRPRTTGRNPVADAFEARLLRWIESETGATPISCTGLNGTFWHVQLDTYCVDLAVIAERKNTVEKFPPGIHWILRVEEPDPQFFTPLIETLFVRERRLRRKVAGKTRVQFKSLDLEDSSGLGTKRHGKPQA